MSSGKLKVVAQGELEIVMTRDFDAPRNLVFDAWIKPELVRRWLLGPEGYSMSVCEIDARPGGSYRFGWRDDTSGEEMGMGGEYLEVVRPERIVTTEKFDQAWGPGEAVQTTSFTESGGKTTVVNTVRYETREARDAVLQSPMEEGTAICYDRLDEILASQSAGAGA